MCAQPSPPLFLPPPPPPPPRLQAMQRMLAVHKLRDMIMPTGGGRGVSFYDLHE